MSEHPSHPVHILLATYNGAKYLQAQLDSIAKQTYNAWALTVSDDGSQDGTLEIVRAFAASQPAHRIVVLNGPRSGSTANFFNLLHQVKEVTSDDYFAFCDQDDVWLEDKLERAVRTLRSVVSIEHAPLLYCARTRLVDEQLVPIGLSEIPGRPLHFRNALLQNVASGNTMVFNGTLLHLFKQVPVAHSVWHDWTAYQLTTGCGGTVVFDQTPALLYRQHSANVIGASNSLWDRVLRVKMVVGGRYREWGDKTELALKALELQLAPSSRQDIERFHSMRHANGPLRRSLAGLQSGLYRQTLLGQVALLVALFFRKA
jgi:glycosyltransferase involved in cell wall biosynthesis